jgi:hypothetical protein
MGMGIRLALYLSTAAAVLRRRNVACRPAHTMHTQSIQTTMQANAQSTIYARENTHHADYTKVI